MGNVGNYMDICIDAMYNRLYAWSMMKQCIDAIYNSHHMTCLHVLMQWTGHE